MPTLRGETDAAGLRIAVVVARFNDFVTTRLKAGALEALALAGLPAEAVSIVEVPGSFEIPLAAKSLALSKRFDAIVCLGCLIRGETPHFEYISAAVAHGLMTAAQETRVPMSFGVLTTNSAEEALARAGQRSSNKGWEAAMAAIEMANLLERLKQPSTPGGIRV